MGLNARDIPLQLLRVLQVSVEKSYNSMKKHPRIWGVLLILFTLYIFLSCIYNLLVFLSPFLVCTAILVRIFWSSEQTYIKCVEKKKEEKRVETKIQPKVVTNERRGKLYKFPSQNATSRRRNFTGKKLDVYGDLEQKAKNLSAVFHNEFTNRNSDIRGFRYLEKEIDSLGYKLTANKIEAPTKKVLFSEPLIVDLETCGAGYWGQEKKRENIVEEKKAQEDSSNKVVELKEDDQKNQMDLGICEMERNKRLENLIARRRARKQLRLQIENGLIDLESVTPSQIAPLFIARLNPFDSPRYFDGIDMPGSAPSGLRSPFDIPYEPFEEKPNLKWDSFDQEFISDLLLERRPEFEVRDHRLPNQRVRRLSGKGIHFMPEQLISKESSESEQASSVLREGEETTHKEERKCKIDIIFKESSESEQAPSAFREGEETTQEEERKFKIDMAGMKGKELDNVDPTSYMPDNASEPNLVPTITNVERVIAAPKLHERVLNFPISNTNVTDINDSLYESLSTPVEKKKENMFFTNRQITHTPSCSLASDLQVEVSEIGSPTLTIDESNETITTTDGEYDGDVDKDVNSGSEDMWGASLHSREVRGISEHDILEANNWREIANSSIPLQNIDEENAADVSSMSSRSDILDDTPTYAMSSDHNIFGNVRDTGACASQPCQYSPDVLARWKRLVKLMDTHINHLPSEIISEKPEDCNQTENSINNSQVINDVNNSAATEQDNTEDLRSNEESGASVSLHETTNEVSTNSSSSSSSSSSLSPRSVLPIPQKTVEDQEIHVDVEQSDMEDVAQETVNGDSMPENIQPSMSDSNVESHNGHSQEQTYPLENFILESNMSRSMNDAEVCSKEDQMLTNDGNIEDQFNPRCRQEDASAEQHSVAEMTTSQDMNEESTELFENKVPLISLMLESSSEIHMENEENAEASARQDAVKEPCIIVEATDTSTAKDFKANHESLNERLAILSSCISAGESDKLSENHSSNEVNYFQSELKEEVRDPKEREQLGQGDMSEDSPFPMVTEVTNADKINKNEATDTELSENNQTIVLSEPAGESDKVNNIAHLSDT